MAVNILNSVLVGLTFLIGGARGACDYPSNMRGQWMSSEGIEFDFSKTSAKLFDTTWTCDQMYNGSHVIKINITDTLENYEFICLEFVELSSTRYRVKYRTQTMPGSPVGVEGLEADPATVCIRGQGDVPLNMQAVFWKKDSPDFAKLPNSLIGKWKYTAGRVADVDECKNVSSLHVCSDTTLKFDVNKCPAMIVNTTDGVLECLDTWKNNGFDYIILRNMGLPSGAACMVHNDGKFSVVGGLCRVGQSPTSLGSGSAASRMKTMDYLITLTKDSDGICPETSASWYIFPSLVTMVIAAVFSTHFHT